MIDLSNEESNNSEPRKVSIRVDPAKFAELKRLVSENNQNLAQENAELSSKLESIAKQEFEKKCREYGLDSETATPEDLRIKKEVKKELDKQYHGDTAILDQNQIEGRTILPLDLEGYPLDMTGFDSQEQMIASLNHLRKAGNSEATEVLSQLARKIQKSGHGLDIEYQGKITDLYRKSPQIQESDSDDEIRRKSAKIAKLRQNRTNWKPVN